MSAGKEIRSKIKSVQNTQKITRAMQMVATSKMRKTQEKMRCARPYAENIRRVIANLTKIGSYTRNSTSFLRKPSIIKKAGVILITTDKGLCGGLNTNTLKVFYEKIHALEKAEINIEVCAIGHKGLNVVSRLGMEISGSAVGIGDIPQMEKLVGPLSGVLNKFYNGEIDEVYVIYSQFINTMKQQAVCERLMPIADEHFVFTGAVRDYLYEPDATLVLEGLIRRYIESVIYQCVADNMASEQAARMVAMKAATDNAGDAISQLKLAYNKSRQAAITKELAEIVAGSSAV
ncbi:MAG: F0F1 ATP synthase subunit gamma [Neisseriaceae bacterium]|jgi:F-type H+-transporting ATPase subunit gamma